MKILPFGSAPNLLEYSKSLSVLPNNLKHSVFLADSIHRTLGERWQLDYTYNFQYTPLL